MGTLADTLWGRSPDRKLVGKELRDFIRYKQGFKCKKCGCSLKRGGHLHHRNGKRWDNSPSNLEFLCTKCHKKTYKPQANKRVKERKKSW